MNIKAVRKTLSAKAERQPEHARTYAVLSKQLMNFDKGNDSERAALRPMIAQSIKQIERGCGR